MKKMWSEGIKLRILCSLSVFFFCVVSHGQSGEKVFHNVLTPFFSDGCSFFPEKILNEKQRNPLFMCCFEHDKKYWAGGSLTEKKRADLDLLKCVNQVKKGRLGGVMYYGSKMSKWLSFMSLWGWGWGWILPFSPRPLTSFEKWQWHNELGAISKEPRESYVDQLPDPLRSVSGDYCIDKVLKKVLHRTGHEVLNYIIVEDLYRERSHPVGEGSSRILRRIKLKVNECFDPVQVRLRLMDRHSCDLLRPEFSVKGSYQIFKSNIRKACPGRSKIY